MFRPGKQIKDWNRSLCNPYNGLNSKVKCDDGSLPKTILVVPEKPHILKVAGTRISPFALVERLRTPIDNLHFEIYEYNFEGGELIRQREIISVYKYQAYLPSDWINEDRFYMLRCYASNDAGISVWSDYHDMDFSNSEDCYIMDTYYMYCDTGMCCSHVYVCT